MKDVPQPELREDKLMPEFMEWLDQLGVPMYEELPEDER